jgi:ABC-type nitrate/sulfonate/bicarbonate transport system substrate-binding protein
MISRLTLSNRPENLKLLQEFVQRWAQDQGLTPARQEILVQAAAEIFRRLLAGAYPPGQTGFMAVTLEEKGARVRLMFEDDAPPYNPTVLHTRTANAENDLPSALADLQNLADSLIYYRTTDRKNRLVLFVTL